MKRLNLARLFVMAILLLGLSATLPFVVATPADAQGGASFEVVFTVGVGDQGIHYAGVGKPEMLVWGPTAFAIAPDGSFWISDTPVSRLLHYSATGLRLGAIDLSDRVVGANDVRVTASNILILDAAAVPPKILRLALDGTLLGTYTVPGDHDVGHGLSGIAIGDQGEVLIEREGGARVSQLVDASGRVSLTSLDGYTHRGRLYSARPADLNTNEKSRGQINLGGKTIQVQVPHTLGGLRILGVKPDESVYVIADELETASTLQVDRTVRHYDATGKLLGSSRIPIAQQYTYIPHGLALGPDSAVYAALTRPDHLAIVRLKFSERLDPVLPPAPLTQSAQQGAVTLTCVSRDTIISTANNYQWNNHYLSDTNINGACSGRGKPRYLAQPGYYGSVSYDWGGVDTIAGFNSYMSPGTYQAGDIDAAASESCSRGVDCSGFVQRTWELAYPPKYSTYTLRDVSTLLASTNNLQRGDIMNKAGVHTALFGAFQTGGMASYESTTWGNFDKVQYLYSGWDRFTGYEPRKYNSVCP